MDTPQDQTQTQVPAFALLVPECKRHSISRTVAFQLVRDGMLETFQIGARRYVLTESLRTLPQRLAERAASRAAA